MKKHNKYKAKILNQALKVKIKNIMSRDFFKLTSDTRVNNIVGQMT